MLIIGLGNPDRGDDAAGILVARNLREHGIKAVEHAGAMLALLDRWAVSERVIVIDAVVSGAAPGSIQVWDPWKVPLKRTLFRASTHEFSLADTIELARVLNRLPTWIRIYGIEANRFETGIEPSEEVVSAAKRVTVEIERIVAGGLSVSTRAGTRT
ncbi:MAG: hydrogenase maturation protease [Acidobacteriaceae bacterium]|nr:hydrogenase maturation protease [Acidobacteriaceae bacterium]